MSQLGDFLKKAIEEEMEFNKRLASGESVATLREEIKDGHLLIYGVDYWDEINNGVPAGTLVDIEDLRSWVNAKSQRYGGTFPPITAIQRRIYAKGSSTPKENLNIIPKVLKKESSRDNKTSGKLRYKLFKIKIK
jgi:hypothetical protein